MQPAALAMKNALANTQVHIPSLPIISNVTAKPVTNPQEIKDLLVSQVTDMVRWREGVEYLATQNVSTIMEIGFGKILTGLIKRIDKNIEAFCIANSEDISKMQTVDC
jgi:[acyl-carrier-protein] S-malonyltransferase